MDSFELNKILGALLFTCLCLLALSIGAEAMFHPVKPAKPAPRKVAPPTSIAERAAAGGAEEAAAPVRRKSAKR